jgi:hypothetical protein
LSHLRICGCGVYIKHLQPTKLDPRSDKCYFVGYPKETIGYSFYQKSEDKVFVAKNGHFLEKEFIDKEVSGRIVQLDKITESPEVERTNEVEPISEVVHTTEPEVTIPAIETPVKTITEPRRSGRVIEPPEWFHNEIFILEEDEPTHYREAMVAPNSKEWQKAMQSEMESMYENQVWNLVDLLEGVKPIQSKWIFKRKIDADGNPTIYKARLVAKGFLQIEGVDYDETFSPVAMLKSVRIMMATAAYFDYDMADGCQNRFPKRFSERGCIHDTTIRFCRSKGCRKGVQA